jgi:YebC/PmpR family DNA-binding regulatory protein
MAGHSKWKNIQHRKGKQDQLRGKLFTKISREIFVAARQGGGNPETNGRLKAAIQKARAANMPQDNIERTIKKALGELEGVQYEEMTYEGYGPGGAAVMVEVLTDNRNRSAAEVRHVFSKRGGNLGESGCVSWMFQRKGLLAIDKESAGKDEDDLMMLALEAGAEDFRSEETAYEILTSPEDFQAVYEALEREGLSFTTAEVTYVPQNTVRLSGQEAEKMLALLEALEDLDDVQNVYNNAEFDEPEA